MLFHQLLKLFLTYLIANLIYFDIDIITIYCERMHTGPKFSSDRNLTVAPS